MSRPEEQHESLRLHAELKEPVAKKDTKCFVFQFLDTKEDWRTGLKDAQLYLDGDKSALSSSAGLGVQVDDDAGPRHLLALRPDAKRGHVTLPACKVSSVIKIGSSLTKRKMKSESSAIKLVPLPVDKDTTDKFPLAYWKMGPLPDDDVLKSLRFDTFRVKENYKGSAIQRHELRGTFETAPNMRLVGKSIAMRGANYIVGILPGGSKKMLLYDSAVFWVERDPEFGRDKDAEERAEAEERKNLAWKTQRSDVIKLSGAAQKKRLEASKELKIVEDDKVMDLDTCISELNKRTGDFQDMEEIKENDAMKLKTELLPHFDLQATEPERIYTKGLHALLPKHVLQAENSLLSDDRITVSLQKPAKIAATGASELQDIFKGRFAAAVAQARAEAIPGSPSLEDAEHTSRRFCFMVYLMGLYSNRKQGYKYNLPQLAQFLEEKSSSTAGSFDVAKHIFKVLFTTNPAEKKVGKLNRQKLLCHIIVLALDLSLSYKLDFYPLMQELRIEGVAEMEQMLRYVGATVNRKREGQDVAIHAELKAPLSWPEAKGAGRGKRRRT